MRRRNDERTRPPSPEGEGVRCPVSGQGTGNVSEDGRRGSSYGLATRQVHAGVEADPATGAILTPIHQTTTFVQPSVDRYRETGYSYSRSHNPTVRAFETRLAALEGGVDACAFGAGMAAIHAVLLAFLRTGEHAIVSDVAFGGTLRLCRQVLAGLGLQFTFADTSDLAAVEAGLRPNTRLIFTETPANPTLKLTDLAAVSDVARARGVLHVVDNTLLTPWYQRPLDLGADLVVHSTTKYLDGHNATVGGAVVCAAEGRAEAVRFVQNATGSIMSPFVAWLTLQGCKTLSVRMDAQSAAALRVAHYLEGRPEVRQVLHPGLASFPQHALASRQASGYGAMLCCELRGGLAAGKRAMAALRLWSLAENLGTVESLVTHPATMTHANLAPEERARLGITDGLVRLSVGLETPDDLIADLDQALARV